MLGWLTDVRKTALLAAVAIPAAVLPEFWTWAENSARLLAMPESIASPLFLIPSLLAQLGTALVFGLFYFFLATEPGQLRVPAALRWLCLAAAAMLAANIAIGLIMYRLMATTTLGALLPMGGSAAPVVRFIAAGAAQVLVLLGLFCHREKPDSTAGTRPMSRLLGRFALAWTVFVALFGLAKLTVVPLAYSQLQRSAEDAGAPPSVSQVMAWGLFSVVASLSSGVAPLVAVLGARPRESARKESTA